MAEEPAMITYASVVSKKTIIRALMIPVLNDLRLS